MYFGYSKLLHPKLPNSIIGDEKASATFKLVVHTSASIVVTSILAFGDKIYNVAHDMLFEKSEVTPISQTKNDSKREAFFANY